MNKPISEILETANHWINNQNFEQEMTVMGEYIKEHNHCYSISWCIKSEKDLNWKEKTVFVGAGRLLISKNGEKIEFSGSAPGVDWVHLFELKVQGLEEYWYLEIPYEKKYLSKLKFAMNCSTPELLQKVNENGKIVFTEPKSWSDHFSAFHQIAEDLNKSGIDCQVIIRERRIS